MHEIVTLFTTLMTAGPGVVGLVALTGILLVAFAIHLCSVRIADLGTARSTGLATREQARSRRVLRQRDPDAAGHTRSRAPSAA